MQSEKSRIVKRTSEEIKTEIIKETDKETAKETAEILKKSILEEAGSGGTKSKVSQILENATKGKASQQTDDKDNLKGNDLEKEKEKLEEIKKRERMELDKEREKLQKEKEESELDCPLCSGTKHEHKHLLKKTEKGTLKCSGEGCNTEYLLIPKDADYKCSGCGLPKKKPLEENPEDNCPYCNSKTFLKYDWSKIVNKDKKK